MDPGDPRSTGASPAHAGSAAAAVIRVASASERCTNSSSLLVNTPPGTSAVNDDGVFYLFGVQSFITHSVDSRHPSPAQLGELKRSVAHASLRGLQAEPRRSAVPTGATTSREPDVRRRQ